MLLFVTKQEAREMVKRLTSCGTLGVLATVDSSGAPHARWMGTAFAPTLKRITTLTSPNSRKVTHIRNNPKVEWVFMDPSTEEVVHLSGSARINDDISELKQDWNALEDKRRAYFLRYQDSGIGFVAIETMVHLIECAKPQEGVHATFTIHELTDQTPASA